MFLATTALEDFWDTTKPIAFLGRWCLLRARRPFWERLNGRLLRSPFHTRDAAHAAYQYIDDVYERALPLLRDVLNTAHGECHSLRFWRITLGPWLRLYLSVYYDRYRHITSALEQYPDCSTITLHKESFVVASDALDFARRIKGDSFNLQIYTQLLETLGMSFPSAARAQNTSAHDATPERSWKVNATNSINTLYLGAAKLTRPSVYLRHSYFSRLSELRIFLKTKGAVLPIIHPLTDQALPAENPAIRQTLPNICVGNSEFEQCLSSTLFFDIPRAYLEGFRSVNHNAEHLYPANPAVIMSANGWHYDEPFKQWAASSAEKGALLVGTPHGGNYGGLADMPAEDHETAIVDRYYSWGWERNDCRAEVIPFPASKFVGRSKIGASNRRAGVLWATSSSPRYLVHFPFLPEMFHEYLRWQERFAKALDPGIVSVLRLRPHREDEGWEIAQRVSECIPGITVETWELPFRQSMATCQLYVCDHLSTTFIEALVADKPTILFWDPQVNTLRASARPYYNLLRRSGILFDTPESAAAAVGSVYNNVETWWNEPQRQYCVKAFCGRFAKTSPAAVELWASEFKGVATRRARQAEPNDIAE